jgi:hypothetical protein
MLNSKKLLIMTAVAGIGTFAAYKYGEVFTQSFTEFERGFPKGMGQASEQSSPKDVLNHVKSGGLTEEERLRRADPGRAVTGTNPNTCETVCTYCLTYKDDYVCSQVKKFAPDKMRDEVCKLPVWRELGISRKACKNTRKTKIAVDDCKTLCR